MATWCLRLGAAAIRRPTSSGLRITGSLRGTATWVILSMSSGRPSVMSKKNFNPVRVALMVTGPVPVSTRCNWKRRRSSVVAVCGERPRKVQSLRTARM